MEQQPIIVLPTYNEVDNLDSAYEDTRCVAADPCPRGG